MVVNGDWGTSALKGEGGTEPGSPYCEGVPGTFWDSEYCARFWRQKIGVLGTWWSYSLSLLFSDLMKELITGLRSIFNALLDLL